MDDGFVGFGGDGGGQFAETRVLPDAGELLECAAVVGVGLRVGGVDCVLCVGFDLHWGEEEGGWWPFPSSA